MLVTKKKTRKELNCLKVPLWSLGSHLPWLFFPLQIGIPSLHANIQEPIYWVYFMWRTWCWVLGKCNELDIVSALKEQGWRLWIHCPQILRDSRKGHHGCQKNGVWLASGFGWKPSWLEEYISHSWGKPSKKAGIRDCHFFFFLRFI